MKPGDPADTLMYILDGQLTVLLEDEDGKEIILAYLNKKEFIGEMGMFVSQPTRSVIIRTRTPCEIAEISYQRLETLLENELKPYVKEFLFAVGKQLSDRLLSTSRKVSHLAFFDVTGRVASTLLDLCQQPDAMTHPDGMQIRITRQEIGRIVGCSREMVGRVLKNLEAQGLISVKGKTMVIFGARQSPREAPIISQIDGHAALCPSYGASKAEQFGQACAGVRGAHEGLAYQEAVDAVLAHERHVFPLEDPRLGDHQFILGNRWQQLQRGLQAHLEGAQVAVVDAHHGVLHPQRALQLLAVVHLDEHVHAQLPGQVVECRELRVVEAGDDEQDAVRLHGPRLVDLVGVDDEILADHRQLAHHARALQVLGRSLEEVAVGEYRQAGGPVGGVADGELGRPEILAQHPLRG